jgi:DNA-binding FadR family transcriptional regulator
MPGSTEVSRPWTRDSLAEHIESVMLPRVLQAGQALPSERTLSETLGVSRSLVREVLRGLEQRGVVDVLPGKGAYPRRSGAGDTTRVVRGALPADGVDSQHLIEVRVVVEGQAAALAARRCTPDQVAALTSALDDRGTTRDFVTQAAITVAFHALVVRCAENPVLNDIYASLYPSTLGSMVRTPLAASVSAQIDREGRNLVAALASGDAQRSADAMLVLLEVERTWTAGTSPSRSAELVIDAVKRAAGSSPSITAFVESVTNNYAPGQFVRKVAHA